MAEMVRVLAFADWLQITSSPRETKPSELHGQDVSHQTGMPSISIWEGMDLHEPVMESHREFVHGKCFLLDPIVRRRPERPTWRC